MKVQEAIKTIETLGGYKFLRRQRVWDEFANKYQTAYFFDGMAVGNLASLRFYAKQFAYTHRANWDMFNKNKALELLKDGFKKDFAYYLLDSKEFDELLEKLASEFVGKNIPITDPQTRTDMASMLVQTIKQDDF